MNPQDDKKMQDDLTQASTESLDDKPSLSRRLIHKTLQRAQDAVEFASDTSRNIVVVADAALDAIDHVTHQTKRGVIGCATLYVVWCLKPAKRHVRWHWSWQEPRWEKAA